MPHESVQNLLKLAVRLAGEAVAIAQSQQGRATVTRKGDNSVVTSADHAIQDRILEGITRSYPDHAVWAEESIRRPVAPLAPAGARYCWVVDPLDGTRNYVAGFPCYAVSIAVLDRGRPVAAVVSEPNLGHLYTATRGGGTRFNDETIRVGNWPKDIDLLIGVPSSKDLRTVGVVQHWTATSGFVLRNLGSTALHLGLVASGALGAAFCQQCRIWDIAAGVLLVLEAGGMVTDPFGAAVVPFDLSGEPDGDLPILAAAPDIHGRLLESIRSMPHG